MKQAAFKLGVAFGSTLFAAAAHAHECRTLGHVADFLQPGIYTVCLGFSGEDGVENPGKGNPNNLDFFPLWQDPNADPDSFEFFVPLDTRKGDKVDIKATLYYLNDVVWDPACDEDFNCDLDHPGVGYESPVALRKNGKIKFQHTITETVPVDAEDAVAYRGKKDVILPFEGMYAWVITGTIQKKGEKAVYFTQKYTCQSPRDPATDEGWFNCAIYPLD